MVPLDVVCYLYCQISFPFTLSNLPCVCLLVGIYKLFHNICCQGFILFGYALIIFLCLRVVPYALITCVLLIMS